MSNNTDIIIPDIQFKEGDESLFPDMHQRFYAKEPLLDEALAIAKIAREMNAVEEDFHTSHRWFLEVFGHRYTHGGLVHWPYRGLQELSDKWRELREDVSSSDPHTYTILEIQLRTERKSLQDEYLNAIKQRYLKDEIIKTVISLGLDPVKFWYAILWLKDYIDTMVCKKRHDSPIDTLTKTVTLLNLIDRANEEYKFDVKGVEFSIRVGQGTDNRITSHSFTTARFLKKAIELLIDDYKKNPDSDEYWGLLSREEDYGKYGTEMDCLTNFYGTIDIGTFGKAYLFRKYLKLYLKEFKADKKTKAFKELDNNPQNPVSTDKELLISRLCVIFGYAPDTDEFYYSNTKLKDQFKGSFNKEKVEQFHSTDY